jgi:hypothetical protein
MVATRLDGKTQNVNQQSPWLPMMQTDVGSDRPELH